MTYEIVGLGEPPRSLRSRAVGLSAPAPFFGGSALRAPPPKKRRVRFYPSRAPTFGVRLVAFKPAPKKQR
jgi:hypothetical protein